MEWSLSRLIKGDKVIWLIFTILCLLSLVECFSAIGTLSYGRGNTYGPIIRHGMFLLVGYSLVVVLHNFHYKYTALLAYVMLALSVVLLAVTLVSGVEENGAARWLDFFGIQLQPSELAKLSLVMYIAWALGKGRRSQLEMEKAFWRVLLVTAVVVGLIIKENMSTALLILAFVYFMFIIAGVPRGHIIRLTVISLVMAGLLFSLLYFIPSVPGVKRWPTWHNRLHGTEQVDVRSPEYRQTDENRQVHHAKIAVANGRFLGVLPGNSTQRDFLPQAYSDFIYAIIIEDLGWLGLFGVPALYIFLLFRCRRIARQCTRAVPILLVMGSALIICMQAFVNMAVAVGFFPVTGQPLPLVSRGGTSGLITCVYFAVILSVSRFGASEDEAEVLAAEEAEEAQEAARREWERLSRQVPDTPELSDEDYAAGAE